MSRKSLRGGVAIAFALALGCGAPATGQMFGSYDATVTLSTGTPVQISGYAKSFEMRPVQKWHAMLMTPGGGSSLQVAYSGARPPIGEHDIVDWEGAGGDPPTGKFIITGNVDPQLLILTGFHSIKGKIVVTASTAASVEGTFHYTARGAQNGQVITVDGSFTTINEVNR